MWRHRTGGCAAYSAGTMSVDVLPANVSSAVAATVDSYLQRVRSHAPGMVDGVYLTGSVALGDVHPGRSDVDVVTVLRARPDAEGLRALADLHEGLALPDRRDPAWDRTRARFDGWYLTWDDLAAAPAPGVTLGLRALDRRLFRGPGWVPPALLWHELAEHALHVAGPSLEGRVAVPGPEAVRASCRQTLDRQWVPWWQRTAKTASAAGLGALGPLAPATGVLGVARIRYTLETGRVTSKCGGGEWALDTMHPRWRRILTEALRVRHRPDRPSLYRSPWQRRRDALAFVDAVLTEAESTDD